MRKLISVSTVWLSVAISAAVLAAQAQVDAPDKYFRAEVAVQNDRSTLFIQNNKTNECTVVWTGAAGSMENSVEYGKEKVAKIIWSPALTSEGDRLLLLITEVQRYADVYDPNAMYMFSGRQARLLWSKVLGRRWAESVDWSPHGEFVVTVTSPVGIEGVRGDACLVISSTIGREVKTIHLDDLISRGLATVSDMKSARFVSEDVIRLTLYEKGTSSLTSYDWHFHER